MEILERIPWAAKNSIFARLGEIAEVANLSKMQRRKYDHDLKIFRDSCNVLSYAKEEGREEGREEERYTIALNMLKKGLSLELVAEVSGLTVTEVEKLKESLD